MYGLDKLAEAAWTTFPPPEDLQVARLFAGPHIDWLDRIEALLRYPSENDVRGLINIAADNAEVHSSITIVNESPLARTVRFVTDAMLPVEVKGITADAEEYVAYLQHIDPFTLLSGESKVMPITFTIAAIPAGRPSTDFLDFGCLTRELDYLRRARSLPGAINQGNEYAVNFKVDTGHGEIREYPITFRTTRVSNFPDSILNPYLVTGSSPPETHRCFSPAIRPWLMAQGG